MISVKSGLEHRAAQPMKVMKYEIEIAERANAGFNLAGEPQHGIAGFQIYETRTAERQSDLRRLGKLRTRRPQDDDMIVGMYHQIGDIERLDDDMTNSPPRIEKKHRDPTSRGQPWGHQGAHRAFEQHQRLGAGTLNVIVTGHIKLA